MKRFLQLKTWNLVLLLMLLLASKSMLGQVLFTENFNYSGTISSNGWTAITPQPAVPNVVSTTSGLTFTDYLGSGIGNAAQLLNLGGEDYNISFASQNTNSQSVYFSFLVNVNDAATTKSGDYFFISGSPGGATWTAFAARVFAKITAGSVYFGLSNTSTATYGTTAFAKNTTYLLVIKYTIVTGTTADPVSLWIIPSGIPQSEALAGTPEVSNTTTNGTDAISTIGLRQGSASNSVQTIVDGFRVGLTWADILPSTAVATITGTATTTPFTTTFGTASTAQQFPVSGANLTDNLVATAPTGFEVSNDGTTYGTTATFTQTLGVASGTLYVRLSATAVVGTAIYDNQNIVLSSTGATSINITTSASGNAVTSASLQNQTITFGALADVTYGGSSFTVSATSSASLTNFTFSSSNQNVATIIGNTITIVGAGTTTITASQEGNSTYNPGSAQSTLVVNQKSLTMLNAMALDKVYNGNNAAVLSGTLDGVISPDVVTVSLTGTFATVDVANGIAVTSTASISGANASNYILVQPTGLSANITVAPQSITFSTLAPKVVGEALTLNAFSATSAVNPISYISSNPTVASISGSVVTILAPGTTVITASQVGSSNYAAASVSQTLNVVNAIAKWTFETADFSSTASQTPVVSVGSALAEYGGFVAGSEVSGSHASASTVWSTPTGNASANSLSANNWAVGDYFQFKVATENFYNLSVSYDQAGSSTGPKDFKFQYSIDGITFTDFGTEYSVNASASPNAWSSSNYYSLFTNSNNLNALTEVNNKPFVYFRIVNTTTAAINLGTTATTGTDRVDNFTVIGSPCPAITPSFSVAPSVATCIANNTTYTTESGQANYVWTIPGLLGTDYTIASGGVGATDNSVTLHWMTSGEKAVSVSYSNSYGCLSTTTSNTTTIIDIPTFTVTNPTAVCEPSTVNITTSVSNTALAYQYYTNSNATTVYATPTAATSGTYYIIGGNGTCYTAPQAVVVTVNALPTFTVTNPTAVCAPETVNITTSVSNTALAYQYYTNSNATSVYATPTAATSGTYYIIGGDGTCYTAPQAVVVTVNALPTFTVTNPTAVCAPETVNITTSVSNTALAYQYYTNSNATSLYTTPTAATSGTYYIIGGNGTCYTAPQAVVVTVNALPTVAAITGITTLGAGGDTTTLASTTSGGVWSSSDPAVATVNPNGVVTGISMGSSTITYTVTIGGCSNSVSVIVGVSVLGTTDFDSTFLSFYPNPVQENLNLNYKESISKVEMYNLLGQKVLETHPNSNFTSINVSNFSNGAYFVKITSGAFFTTIKVIKK